MNAGTDDTVGAMYRCDLLKSGTPFLVVGCRGLAVRGVGTCAPRKGRPRWGCRARRGRAVCGMRGRSFVPFGARRFPSSCVAFPE